MSQRLEEDEVLANLIVDLDQAAQIPAKQRAVKITGVINRICDFSYESGISETNLEGLVDVLTRPNHLDTASSALLIRSLYPSSRVSDSVVVNVVASLGHGEAKVPFSAQAAFLKWLVMVYDVLESQKVLSRLYSVLFNLLDTIAIRAPLCHLLSLITLRRHVRPFRIQMLLELARRVGNEPQLIGLIRVYKDYYPDVIVGETASGRATVFTHPNLEWKQRLIEIQEFHQLDDQDGAYRQQQAFRVTRRGLSGVKRGKTPAVPEVRTSSAQETSTTLEEIDNVRDFVENLEKIVLPNQLVAVMGDPLLQKLLQLKSDEIVLQRVDRWLLAFFEDQLADGGQSQSSLLDMLASIREYARYTKVLPTACLRYLQSLLVDWNGVTGRDLILDLLSYLPISPFEELDENILQNLEFAILDDEASSQEALLTFYTNLLRQWAISLLGSPDQAAAGTSISALTTRASSLALNLLQQPYTLNSQPTILDFYEVTSTILFLPALQSHIRITTPPASLIYTLGFSSSLSTLSRTCAILALYKRAFETAMTRPKPDSNSQSNTQDSPSKWVEPYPTAYVNHFNGFLMDMCNCLWRSRAFNTTDPNALGCLLPPPIVQSLSAYISKLDSSLSLPALFSLSYSPVLCSLAIAHVRELEDKAAETAEEGYEENGITIRHAGPVTQRSLLHLERDGGVKINWASYRLGVLRYLERHGGGGVGSLMYNTMKNLISEREREKA